MPVVLCICIVVNMSIECTLYMTLYLGAQCACGVYLYVCACGVYLYVCA